MRSDSFSKAEPGADSEAGLRVDFPFLVTLEHRAIGLRSMFEASRAFDYHETESDHHGLHIDVELVQPTRTMLFVSPQKPMSYDEIASEIEFMLARIGPKVFGEPPRLAEIDWHIANKGEHSRGREYIGRIQ